MMKGKGKSKEEATKRKEAKKKRKVSPDEDETSFAEEDSVSSNGSTQQLIKLDKAGRSDEDGISNASFEMEQKTTDAVDTSSLVETAAAAPLAKRKSDLEEVVVQQPVKRPSKTILDMQTVETNVAVEDVSEGVTEGNTVIDMPLDNPPTPVATEEPVVVVPPVADIIEGTRRSASPRPGSASQRAVSPSGRPSSASRRSASPRDRPQSASRTVPRPPSAESAGAGRRSTSPRPPSTDPVEGKSRTRSPRPSSTDVVEGKRRSPSPRPSSAENRKSASPRPGSATSDRPSSAASRKLPTLPTTTDAGDGLETTATERPSSATRPSSASKRKSPSPRPSSAAKTSVESEQSENIVPPSDQMISRGDEVKVAQLNRRASVPPRLQEMQRQTAAARPASAGEQRRPSSRNERPSSKLGKTPTLQELEEGQEPAEEAIEEKEDIMEGARRTMEPVGAPTSATGRPSNVRNRPPSAKDENENELPWAMYKPREEDKEAEEDDIEDEESEDEDQKYAPPTNEELPDLYEVLDNIETDDIELNKKTSPPLLKAAEEDSEYHQRVTELRQGLAEEEIALYLDEFEKRVEEEILMIGSVSLEDVQLEERRLREEHISFQQQQVKVQRQRQEEILQAMERAKKYVMSKYKEKYRELRMREEHMQQKDRTFKEEIHRAFRRAESQLKKALNRRSASVKTMYGDLTMADGQYGGSKGRRWKIDWNRTPQPIQIKLKCLRGVKDKLPKSRYVLMVSLYDRLGGHVMKWSNLKGQQWGGATLPLHHDGEFFNVELKLDQSVFTVCPSKPDMRPGMLLLFELFILRGPVTPTDKVVGWACFPVCDSEFNVIDGKYKTPMLRGDCDPAIDKFEMTEKLMAHDLENWLCNLYFEIVKLPRYMGGQKEYEVELQFTSGMLGSPPRTNTGEENVDGEKAIFGSTYDLNTGSQMGSRVGSQMELSDRPGSSAGSSVDLKRKLEGGQKVSDDKIPLVEMDSVSSAQEETESVKPSVTYDLPSSKMNSMLSVRKSNKSPAPRAEMRPFTSVGGSRKVVEEAGLQLPDDDGDSSDSDYGHDDQVKELHGDDEVYKPVKGQPGMFYKVHYDNPTDVYARKMMTLMPKTPLLARKTTKKKITHLEELDLHSYSIKVPWSNKGGLEHKGTKKMQYIGRMFLSEMGISQMKSREFWAMMLMLLVTFFMRLYIHYFAQYVVLMLLSIPVNKFDISPVITVEVNYQNTLLTTAEEVAMIMIGPCFNIFLFTIMVIISSFIQILFERFPAIFSRFVMAYGLNTMLDPIWILIVDAAFGRYQNLGKDSPIADFAKMYWHLDRFYSNETVTLFISIFITLFLYFITIFTTVTILYMYFLRLHNNGRLMDIYHRLHGEEEDFFIPFDLEISNEELNFICRKAEQWRGEEGERRKTAVYDYVWEEEEMQDEEWDDPSSPDGKYGRLDKEKKSGNREITTHVSLHTLHLDGLRELYRHFLKLPDGAIVEVFGEMSIPGMDDNVKQELMKRTTFQSVDASRMSLRKRTSQSRMSRKSSNASFIQQGSFLNIPQTSVSYA